MGRPIAPGTSRILDLVRSKPRSLDELLEALHLNDRADLARRLYHLAEDGWLTIAKRKRGSSRRRQSVYGLGARVPKIRAVPATMLRGRHRLPSWIEPRRQQQQHRVRHVEPQRELIAA